MSLDNSPYYVSDNSITNGTDSFLNVCPEQRLFIVVDNKPEFIGVGVAQYINMKYTNYQISIDYKRINTILAENNINYLNIYHNFTNELKIWFSISNNCVITFGRTRFEPRNFSDTICYFTLCSTREPNDKFKNYHYICWSLELN
jgi:hypothetical protein